MSFNLVVCMFLQYNHGTFAQMHLPRCAGGIEIINAAGRVWQIRVDTRQNGIVRRLKESWAGFASAKNIISTDTCVFELMNDDVPAFKMYKVVVEGRGRTLL
ncbi:B3 domain-containing protein-like [Abeliophyllum distichum]|uniref:B3 domain-containing protein-like n=1 Tax=Abeliophyllum distichum TaxID=126358 RepID=A0ABD1PDC5_9LAMI